MGTYISSNANRFYAAVETGYGVPAGVVAANRFPAVRLKAHQALQAGRRLDKTGTRTYFGAAKTSRRQSAFEVRTYLPSWNGTGQPCYGPLVQSAMGAAPQITQGLILASTPSGSQLETTAPHGLSLGSAVSSGNEIRFVTSVPGPTTLVMNAPFSTALAAGATLAPTITYKLSTNPPSLTLYDYWDPISAVSRMVTGSAVDVLGVLVNGDFHELIFSGPAADLLDSYSFVPGTAGLSAFPVEPDLADFDYSIVPGHLGQVWLGSPAGQFFTLIEASVEIKNNIAVRNQEFGSSYPRAVAHGPRQVVSEFTLFTQDDAQTNGLYAAAKLRDTFPAMLQLGQTQGQMMGIFLPAVSPEIPNYNDSETRLLWQFKNNVAQGTSNDEAYIAFA
jgi:hypothetical protein